MSSKTIIIVLDDIKLMLYQDKFTLLGDILAVFLILCLFDIMLKFKKLSHQNKI